uniref:C-methyltransferase domain-containing protein n=1 Tax=viral metagenome TaxID=1070528 RepID=A0A6C0KHX2_9ZZZZ
MSFNERYKCCICNNTTFKNILLENIKISQSLNLFEIDKTNEFIPYNIIECKKCNSSMIKYLADINIVYGKNHIDAYGSVKSEKHTKFKNFILQNKDIKTICEIGAATGDLAQTIVSESYIEYKIIEPNYRGKQYEKLKIIKKYFENADKEEIKADCLIMSDVFEHFYNPLDALKKIQEVGYKYVILNHPDFDYAIENNHCIILNIEHTFQIEHQLLFNLYNNYGYNLNRRYDFKNFSLFLEFKKENNLIQRPIKNINTSNNILNYIKNIKTITGNINSYINNNITREYYIWPCSVHSTTLFLFGLDYTKFKGILDNSPNKINNYIDGYNLLCGSFNEMIKSENKKITIIISGANAYIKELNLKTEVEIKMIENFI